MYFNNIILRFNFISSNSNMYCRRSRRARVIRNDNDPIACIVYCFIFFYRNPGCRAVRRELNMNHRCLFINNIILLLIALFLLAYGEGASHHGNKYKFDGQYRNTRTPVRHSSYRRRQKRCWAFSSCSQRCGLVVHSVVVAPTFGSFEADSPTCETPTTATTYKTCPRLQICIVIHAGRYVKFYRRL